MLLRQALFADTSSFLLDVQPRWSVRVWVQLDTWKSPIFRHHFVPLSGGWAPPGPASTENVHCSCQLQELHHCFSAHRWWQRLRCASSKTHTLLLWPSARACTACGTLLWSIRVPDEQLATHMSMSLPRAASPPAALDHVHSTILALFQAHMQQARASGSS